MYKIILGLLLLGSTLFAKVTDVEVTPQFIKNTKLKIIDIRTESEWAMAGVIKDAYLLTFFDERGNYDIEVFIENINKIVEKNEQFAIICYVGSRTHMVANLLGKKNNYNVVNLKGGMDKLIKQGFKPTFHSLSISQK